MNSDKVFEGWTHRQYPYVKQQNSGESALPPATQSGDKMGESDTTMHDQSDTAVGSSQDTEDYTNAQLEIEGLKLELAKLRDENERLNKKTKQQESLISTFDSQLDSAIDMGDFNPNYPESRNKLIDGLTDQVALLDIDKHATSAGTHGINPQYTRQEIAPTMKTFYIDPVKHLIEPALRQYVKRELALASEDPTRSLYRSLLHATSVFDVRDLSQGSKQGERKFQLIFGSRFGEDDLTEEEINEKGGSVILDHFLLAPETVSKICEERAKLFQ